MALRFLMLLIALVGLGGDAAAGEKEELEARFRDEYPAAESMLRRVVDNIACEGRRIGRDASYEADLTLLVKDGSRCEIRRYDPDKKTADQGAGQVRCLTPELLFALKQDVPDGAWVVTNHDNNRERMERFALHIHVHVDHFVNAAFQAYDLPIRQLLEDPNVKVTGAREVTSGGLDGIELTFDLQGSSLWYDSGRIVFCPELDWSVREYEMFSKSKLGEPCVTRGRVICERWSGGFVFPRQVVQEFECPVGKKESLAVEQVTFTKVKPDVVSDASFTLAAFDVPDISLDAGRRSLFSLSNGLFWICLCLGIGCLVLLWRWPRRVS